MAGRLPEEKTENGGQTSQGRLSSAEFNDFVAYVADIARALIVNSQAGRSVRLIDSEGNIIGEVGSQSAPIAFANQSMSAQQASRAGALGTAADNITKEQLVSALAGKQDVLIPSTGIDIGSNVISVSYDDSTIIADHETGELKVNTSVIATAAALASGLAGKSAVGHTHVKSQITDFPTSLPASGGTADLLSTSNPSYPEVSGDDVLSMAEDIEGKITEPLNEGTSGQVLTTDGEGGRTWRDIAFSDLTGRGEAFLEWGGKNFAGNYGPVDAALCGYLGANRSMFMPAECIDVEYSRDGGATWTDYGAGDVSKTLLFSADTKVVFDIGKADSSHIATNQYRLRVTMTTSRNGSSVLYSELNKFMMYVATNGTEQNWVTIDARLQTDVEGDNDRWTVFADKVRIDGWRGWNVVNTQKFTTYGDSKGSQYGQVRFTFGCDVGSTSTYTGLKVYMICCYGGMGWATPSRMAKNGMLFDYDYNQGATFPGSVRTSDSIYALNGNFSGTVMSNSHYPNTSNNHDLGAPTLRWKDIYARSIIAHSPSTVTSQYGDGSVTFGYTVVGDIPGLFPVTNNANALVTINRHSGDYYSQIGLSSDGNIYYRCMNNKRLDAVTSWKLLAWSGYSSGDVGKLAKFGSDGTLTPVAASDLSVGWAESANDANTLDGHEYTEFQPTLVSGRNIKTVNGQSLLGSGNIVIQGGGGEVNVIETVKVNGTALVPVNKAVNVTVPTQASDIGAVAAESGKGLSTNDYTIGDKQTVGNLRFYDGSSSGNVTLRDFVTGSVSTAKVHDLHTFLSGNQQAVFMRNGLGGYTSVYGFTSGASAFLYFGYGGSHYSCVLNPDDTFTLTELYIVNPSGGTAGQVLTKTQGGVAWSSGGDLRLRLVERDGELVIVSQSQLDTDNLTLSLMRYGRYNNATLINSDRERDYYKKKGYRAVGKGPDGEYSRLALSAELIRHRQGYGYIYRVLITSSEDSDNPEWLPLDVESLMSWFTYIKTYDSYVYLRVRNGARGLNIYPRMYQEDVGDYRAVNSMHFAVDVDGRVMLPFSVVMDNHSLHVTSSSHTPFSGFATFRVKA